MKKLLRARKSRTSVLLASLLAPLCFGMLMGSVRSSRTEWQTPAADGSTASPQGKISVPLIVKQLDFVNGIIPIYLNCEETVLIMPDILDRIPCDIKNNTGKGIRALVLEKSVAVNDNGRRSTEVGYVTVDRFIHPDFHVSKKDKGIDPEAEWQFPSATESYSGIITQVQVRVDYVEFSDLEKLGSKKVGERILIDLRDGAAKYKSWLARELVINGRSAAALTRLIELNDPIKVVGIRNANQEEGALIYRKWLQKRYQTEGIVEVTKLFNSQLDSYPQE